MKRNAIGNVLLVVLACAVGTLLLCTIGALLIRCGLIGQAQMQLTAKICVGAGVFAAGLFNAKRGREKKLPTIFCASALFFGVLMLCGLLMADREWNGILPTAIVCAASAAASCFVIARKPKAGTYKNRGKRRHKIHSRVR